MKAKLPVLLAVTILVVIASWAGTGYFGPKLFNSQGGSKSPPAPVRTNATSDSSHSSVNLMVSFGNGTIIWFNNTKFPKSYDFYQVTYNLTRGNLVAQYYDSPVLKGYYVLRLLGVGCEDFCLSGQYWSLWTWNELNDCWEYSSLGASLLSVSNVHMAAWYFTTSPSSFPGRCS